MDHISIFIVCAAVFLVLVAAWAIRRHARHRKLVEALSQTLYWVALPREQVEGRPDLSAEMGKMERLLASLVGMNKPFCLEAAVPHIGEEIHFYLSVPRQFAEVAARQVQGIWPHASLTESKDDYNIFNPSGETSGAYLQLEQPSVLPVRTWREAEADTFGAVLSAFSKVNVAGEGAAIQIVAQGAKPTAKKAIEQTITSIRQGTPLDKAIKASNPSLSFKEVSKTLFTTPESLEKDKKEEGPKIVDEDGAKALESKISKPLFLANVRILTSASTRFQSDDLLEGLAAGFSQFSAPKRNAFRVVKVKNPKKLAYDFSFRYFNDDQAMLLNSEELCSFFHFPLNTTDTPKVKWLKSREAPPPPDLPKEGALIGESVFRGESRKIFISDEDRRRHLYVIGQTGTGKSTLLGSMIIDDIRAGKGVAVIDPHGDLAESAVAHTPKERLDDLIYFNPGDLDRPLGLNMLEYNLDRPEEKSFIVNEMLNIFDRLYDLKATGGPMFEQYMRYALLVLMEDMRNEAATLTEVPRVFTDAAYRNRKLERITNPMVVDFWTKEANKAGGEASLANITPYITSKFNTFLANDYMRPIIGQAESAFNFREIMDTGKILIVNLSKGRIGDINANLLGMIITGKLLFSALSRVDSPGEHSRRDFYLYIDEFQNFTTDSIATILSEARKYRLDLIIAHQFIAQLTDKIRDAVFGNVGNILSLRVGPGDTEILSKQFSPPFTESDLLNIDNLNGFAKILVNGKTAPPFNFKVNTSMWSPGDKQLAEKMKEYCRLKYGVPRAVVEDEIYRRLRT